MSTNPWFRLYTETVDDEKLRLLAFEDRWHFVALLCCKGAGLLDSGDNDQLLRRKLAVKLGLSPRELEEVARRLEEVGLIDAETFQPLAWDDRQFKSDSSTARVRKYREKMKRQGNVSVTGQETDTDTEEEREARKPARSSPIQFSTWVKSLPEGEDAIPPDDPVFQFAADAGIPEDMLALAWAWFERTYTGSRKSKRYTDWRQVFRNAVEGNWPRVWRFTPDGQCVLTSEGEMLRRALEAEARRVAA